MSKTSSRFADLQDKDFDLLIIGGGISGAGIARQAAWSGYSTILCDMQDFAAGTSSRSTKLLHGGIRYLEHFEFGLVKESVRERMAGLELAPHLLAASAARVSRPGRSRAGPSPGQTPALYLSAI